MSAPGPAAHELNTSFVWADHSGPFRAVTGAQARQYDERGFFVLRDALGPDEVRALTEAIDPFEAHQEEALRTMEGGRMPKYINTPDGELYHKREVLYGIDLARGTAAKAGRMILVEGYTDVLALHQAGIRNAVGIMGTSLTKEQVRELARLVGVVELCLDADSAGQEAAMRAARMAGASGLELRVVLLPAGSDPGDVISREGAEGLRGRVEESVPFVVFEVGRVLGQADLSSAEGKDRAIAALRPVLAPLQPSVLRDELIHGGAHLDVRGRLFHGQSGEDVHLRIVASRTHDRGGIPQALEDEKFVFDGLERREGLHQFHAIGAIRGAPMVRIDAIAHEHRGETPWGSVSSGGGGFAPGLHRLQPREAEGHADAAQKVSSGN